MSWTRDSKLSDKLRRTKLRPVVQGQTIKLAREH